MTDVKAWVVGFAASALLCACGTSGENTERVEGMEDSDQEQEELDGELDEFRSACASGPIILIDVALDRAVRVEVDLVEMPSNTLEARPDPVAIEAKHVADLTTLDLGANGINTLAGIGCLTSLEDLNLRGNGIMDVSPLATLTSLTRLDLDDNYIESLDPLSSLASLIYLNLRQNKRGSDPSLPKFSSLDALSGLTSLQELNLQVNSLQDVSALETLTDLRELDLNDNRIDDISPLVKLTSLRTLLLERRISN